MNRRFQNLCAVLVFAAMLTLGCDNSGELPAELQRDIGTVSVEVDFGDQKRAKQIDVVCSANSTVLLSLERAQQLDRLKYKSTGSGETAFVESIDGIANESDGKSWVYKVNETLGDKSAGLMAVKPGDVISWTYGTPPDELK